MTAGAMMFATGHCDNLPPYDGKLHYKLAATKPYGLDMETLIRGVEEVSSIAPCLASKQSTSKQRSAKSILLQGEKASEDTAPLPLYTSEDDAPPPPYCEAGENSELVTRHIPFPKLLRMDSEWISFLFGGALYGVREHGPKKKGNNARKPMALSSKKKGAPEEKPNQEAPALPAGSGGASGGANGGDEGDDKKKKGEEARKKREEEEEEAKKKKKQEEEEAKKKKMVEEEAATAEEKRLRLEEEEKRMADEIANNADPWSVPEEEDTGSSWGFLVGGKKKKDAKPKKVAPEPAPAPAPAPPPPLIPPPPKEEPGEFYRVAETAEEIREAPKERERREKMGRGKKKGGGDLRAAGKLPPKPKKEEEIVVEPAPPPKEPTPESRGEGSDEVTSPKIDVDDIDDNDDNVSPTNKDAPKLSGFGGIGLGWKFGLGLTKWGTNASQATLDTASPTGSAIGSGKTPIEEAPKDHFPATKEEREKATRKSKVVEVVEPEPEPTKDETPEPVIMPQEDPTPPAESAKVENHDLGYTTKKVKKGKKADKKFGKVTSLAGVYEETGEKNAGKVASLAGAYEQRASSVKKEVIEKPSKSKSVPASVGVPAGSEPEPTLAPAEEKEEIFYGPGYEQVKQRKYADTTQAKYADASNIGYVPTPEETPYVPVPREPAYAPVPKGPKYAEPKQFEYAAPTIWGFGKKDKNAKNVEVATAPAPPPPPPPAPVVERVPTPEPEPVIQLVVEPEPVKPAKRGKKQKKKSWFFEEPEADPEPSPVPKPPVEEIPVVGEVVEVVEAVFEPEVEPEAEFVEAVAEVVEAEPDELPAVVEPELAPAPAPGPESRRTRKDVSRWSLPAAPKPKKRSPAPEVRMAPDCSLPPPQDIESAGKHGVQVGSGVDTVKGQHNERRPSIEIDTNGSPVKVVGFRELWKMSKEAEKKKKSARNLSPVEKWQADVVPELPPDNGYGIDEEIEGSSHVDAPWPSDADVPLSPPPPPMLPIESYLVPDTPIAAQAPPPVWKKAPTPLVFAPVSRKPSSKKDRKKRSDLVVELQADPIVEEPEPDPELESIPEPVKSTKREAKPKKGGWGFFETVDKTEPEPAVEPELELVVEAPVPEPVIEEPEPELEPIVKPEPEPIRPAKERKQKKKGWFFGVPESEPEVEPEPDAAVGPEPEPEPVRPNRKDRKTKKGWLFGEVPQSIPASEQAVSEPVPELEPESIEELEFEQEISARTPEPSEPEAQFEEAQEEAFAPVQLAIGWPEEKIPPKERRHSHKYKGLKEVVGVKDKEKHRRRKNSSDNTSAAPSSKAPFTERSGTYALSAAPPMERRGTHSSSAPSIERRGTYSSSAPSMERRNTTASTDEAEKAARRERRRLKKLTEQERLREAGEREKEQRRVEKRAKKARKEAEAKEKEAKEKEAKEKGRAREEVLASMKPKLERRKSTKKHPESPAEETREEKEARREARRAKKTAKESSAGTGNGSHKQPNRHSISHAAQLSMAMDSIPYSSPDPYPNGERGDPYQDGYEEEALRRRRREHHNAKKAQKTGIWTNGEALSGSVTPERVPSEEVNGVHFSSSTSQDLQHEEALRERRRKRKEARRSLHETIIDDEEEAKRLRKVQKKEEKRAKEVKESGTKEPKNPGDRAARRAQRESGTKELKNPEDKTARRAQKESGVKELKGSEDRAARRMQRAKRRADSERFNGALTENESASKGSWWRKLLG